MILILTDKDDVHSNIIIEKLTSINAKYFRLNLDVESLQKTYIYFINQKWKISQDNHTIITEDIKVVLARNVFVKLSLEEQNLEEIDFKIWKGEWNKTLLGLYFFLKNRKWLNPLRDAYRAENKYLQYEIAQNIGFKLPEMIVSNQKKELFEFFNKYENIVLKFMNQGFYKSSDNKFKGIYVNKINKEELSDFGDSSENPVVLQAYIEKSYEIRYTVVGKKHFVCKIDSQKSDVTQVDWRRYDIPNTPHYPITPPREVMEKVNILMKELNLEYGALDFIVNLKNEWIFLEINTMGQFLWIEDLTNLPISSEIAKWLAKNDD